MWNPFKRSGTEEQRSIPFGSGGGWGSGGAAPWETTNPEQAIRCVPVWGAVRFLAANIGAMAPGLGLYKLSKDGDIAVRQPTPSLFANPSIHGTLVEWLERAVVSAALQGDMIGLKTQRDRFGFPTMMEWLNPINVQTLDRAIEGPGSYVDPRWYWWGRPMDPADLLHIPLHPRPWRVRGMSPIEAFATSVGVNLAALEFSRQWYAEGGVAPGTFRNTTQKVLPEDAEEISDAMARRLRSRKLLTYGMDWEYNPISIKPHEALFLDTMQATATNVSVIYGVPPEKIGGKTADSLTYSTVEQNSLDCLTYTFRPWLTKFEYGLSTCFPRSYFVQFNTDEFLRIDAKSRAEIDALSLGTVQTGWKDQNEVRASYNLPPRKDPTPQTPTPTTDSREPGDAGDGATPGANSGSSTPPGGQPTPKTSATEPISRYLRDRGDATNGHHATVQH